MKDQLGEQGTLTRIAIIEDSVTPEQIAQWIEQARAAGKTPVLHFNKPRRRPNGTRALAQLQHALLEQFAQPLKLRASRPRRGAYLKLRELIDANPNVCIDHTLPEIGAMIGVTRERVRQLLPKPTAPYARQKVRSANRLADESRQLAKFVDEHPEAILPIGLGGWRSGRISEATGISKLHLLELWNLCEYPPRVARQLLVFTCHGCGVEFSLSGRNAQLNRIDRYAGKRRFCSRDCMNTWKSAHGSEWFVARRPSEWGFGGSKTKAHCKWGHEFSEANTRRNRDGTRGCKACARQRSRDRYQAHPRPQRAPRAPREPRPPKTHCKHGHELSGANLYVARSGSRACKACNLAHHKAAYWRKKAAS